MTNFRNTSNRRIMPSDTVTMKHAKRPPTVTGGGWNPDGSPRNDSRPTTRVTVCESTATNSDKPDLQPLKPEHATWLNHRLAEINRKWGH